MQTWSSLQPYVSDLAYRLGVDVVSLYVLQHDELVLDATHGLNPACLGYAMPSTRGLTGTVVRTGRVLAVKEPSHHPDYHYVPFSGEEEYRSYLGIPLRKNGGVAGVLVLQTRQPRLFLGDEVHRMHAIARQLEERLEPMPTVRSA